MNPGARFLCSVIYLFLTSHGTCARLQLISRSWETSWVVKELVSNILNLSLNYLQPVPLLPVERGADSVEEEAVPLASLVEVVLALSIAHPPTAQNMIMLCNSV